jgi:hypothetical protein
MFDNSLVRPATRFFDVALIARKVSSHPRQAANVDDSDQVRLPNTWWQPRLGFRPVTVEQMLHGPGTGPGTRPGRWTVTHIKEQGVTPGFQIKDAEGGKFLIKFDPPDFPELSTAADVIGSYLFWAAGYNVPENVIATVCVDSLDISKDATYTDAHGHKQPLTLPYVQQLLARVARRADGLYRRSASRFLAGKLLRRSSTGGVVATIPRSRPARATPRAARTVDSVRMDEPRRQPRPQLPDMWITENHARSCAIPDRFQRHSRRRFAENAPT